MKIFLAELWDEFGGLIICFLIVLLISALIFSLYVSCSPDKIVYTFTTGEEVVTFEVSAVEEHTDTYYVFILDDGSRLTYYPKSGCIVTRTEIRY